MHRCLSIQANHFFGIASEGLAIYSGFEPRCQAGRASYVLIKHLLYFCFIMGTHSTNMVIYLMKIKF